jgi:hypothetical protein
VGNPRLPTLFIAVMFHFRDRLLGQSDALNPNSTRLRILLRFGFEAFHFHED